MKPPILEMTALPLSKGEWKLAGYRSSSKGDSYQSALNYQLIKQSITTTLRFFALSFFESLTGGRAGQHWLFAI